MAQLDPRGLDHAHLLVEASRLAFADRNRFLADADFVAVPVAGLLDRTYLSIRAQLPQLDRALAVPIRSGNPLRAGAEVPLAGPRDWAPQAPQPERGTAHLSIVDDAGNVVAMTTTVEAGFGAAMVVRGFILNNELTDFSFLPERDGRPVANRVEGRKRPRSSMSPTIVFDAARLPVLALGSAGGERIIGHVAQTLVAILDNGLSPEAALALPRVAGVHENAELEAGGGAVSALASQLEARGFPVVVRPNASGLQVIELRRTAEGQVLRGAADPRREGVVLGD
jgi:gamma-glutamyltranspeptidase/glutathione hydrolase